MIYVMSDIHGQYEKFMIMLKLINFTSSDTLYILGDAIDRGGGSIGILLYIMKQSNIHFILGNHEDMMLGSFKNHRLFNCWMQCGGDRTLRQFNMLSPEIQCDIFNYLSKCDLYKIIDKYILVHAGMDTSFYNSRYIIDDFMKSQHRDILLWDMQFVQEKGLKEYTVIFGHWTTNNMQSDKPFKIWHDISQNKIGIDCGACFEGGQLGCLRLEDMKEFYV